MLAENPNAHPVISSRRGDLALPAVGGRVEPHPLQVGARLGGGGPTDHEPSEPTVVVNV